MATLDIEARLDNLLSASQEETANIDLFAPITEREECPICLIPLPINENEIRFKICCGKCICNGCDYKQQMNDKKKGIQKHEMKCAFCCQPQSTNTNKALKKLMKRKNPTAFITMSYQYLQGEGVFQSNTKSLELLICAAELGKADAYGMIASSYEHGIAVELNMSKALEFYEVAAKKGSIPAHRWIAEIQNRNGNVDEGIKHYKVVACAGDKEAMDALMKCYKHELVTKEDLSQTLRVYQASSNAMKSKDRDDARTANWLFSAEPEVTQFAREMR